MKYLKTFNENNTKFPKTFCILTQQANDKREEKNDQPVSYAHDGYRLIIQDENELMEYQTKYQKGGKYLDEDIIGTQVLDYLL